MSAPSPVPDSPLLPIMARLLRPLVRLLIRGGITCPTVMDLLRGVYVDVAREMLPDPRAQTDSRISLLTGVHRKELRRLREEGGAGPPSVPQSLTVGSQVAARWLGGPGYQDSQGRPLPLPRTGERSFETLVEAVTRDVRPRAVLDDWLEQGLVTVDDEARLVLRADGFLPRPGRSEQLYYLGRNLHDHAAAAAANVEAEGPAPFFERAVHYDGLSDAAADQIAAAAREAALRMVLEVNRTALAIAEQDDRDAAGAVRRRRVNLGASLVDAEAEE